MLEHMEPLHNSVSALLIPNIWEIYRSYPLQIIQEPLAGPLMFNSRWYYIVNAVFTILDDLILIRHPIRPPPSYCAEHLLHLGLFLISFGLCGLQLAVKGHSKPP